MQVKPAAEFLEEPLQVLDRSCNPFKPWKNYGVHQLDWDVVWVFVALGTAQLRMLSHVCNSTGCTWPDPNWDLHIDSSECLCGAIKCIDSCNCMHVLPQHTSVTLCGRKPLSWDALLGFKQIQHGIPEINQKSTIGFGGVEVISP